MTEDVVALPSTPAHSERRPLMTAKVEDIRKMLRCIGEDNIVFWKEITEWPTVHQEGDKYFNYFFFLCSSHL